MSITKQEIKNLVNKSNPVILEIGCADGIDTLEFLNVFNSNELKLYCFEPDPRNIKSFKEKINDQRVKLFECAIGDKNGVMQFHQSSTIYSSSLKKFNLSNLNAIWPMIQLAEVFDVNVVKIDTFLESNNINLVDFIWADVQGAEDLMLAGATNSLKNKIRYIYTEYSNVEFYENEPSLKDILSIMGQNWEIIADYKSDVLLKNKNL